MDKLIFVFLSMLILSSAFGNDTLAPHPVYFSPNGFPETEAIVLRGKYYIVGWDGASLTLEYGMQPPYNYEPPNEGPPAEDPDDDPYFWYGALFIVGGSIVLAAIWVWSVIKFF